MLAEHSLDRAGAAEAGERFDESDTKRFRTVEPTGRPEVDETEGGFGDGDGDAESPARAAADGLPKVAAPVVI